jgi:predicted RNA-binding Zn-ribbon protein involved in translation (DUF1610 family)
MPYTYYLKNKVTGEKYYGVRYARGCNPSELWVTYFSSSKYVAQRVKEHGANSFEFEIRKEFQTPKQARDWEEKVLRRLDILHRRDWLNQNVCGKFLLDGPKSTEHREKMSENMRALWEKRKQTDWHPPAATPERRAKVSKRLKGVKKSIEHVAHMKCHDNNKATVTCPTCGKTGQYVNMKRWHFENCGKERKLYTCPHCGANKALPGVMRYHFDNCKQRSH